MARNYFLILIGTAVALLFLASFFYWDEAIFDFVETEIIPRVAFYPDDFPYQDGETTHLPNASKLLAKELIKESSVAAGVVPHHLIAEKLIEDFFNHLALKTQPATIIVLGPDHFKAGSILGSHFISLPEETEKFDGMLVDASLLKNIASANSIALEESAIYLDHGITNLLPFVKKYFPDVSIIPLLISQRATLKETTALARSLYALSPRQSLVIASVDFSHYLPATAAAFHDAKSIRVLLNFEKENFENLEVDSWQALYIARAFAQLKNKEFAHIIGQGNAVDFAKVGDENRTTSYFSVVFGSPPSQVFGGKDKEKEKKDRASKSPLSGLTASLLSVVPSSLLSEGEAPSVEVVDGKREADWAVKTVLFVGDIMLDRGVEYFMEKNSFYYPFEKLKEFLRGIDIVFGNLEGPFVENPPYFSDTSLKFAFSSSTAKTLAFFGFNLLSLANNHTLNMGEKGLQETREILKENNISFLGEPWGCQSNFSLGKEGIEFLAFNKTFSFNCSNEEIATTVAAISRQYPESFLVVSLHWGEEYQTNNSLWQKQLAHQLIDAGVDLIIGHHPHVVQNIELYQGRLILYSLGNFIFDQYFSKNTQQGLAVGLELYPEKAVFRLFPLQSELSQPSLMEQEEAKQFLQGLAKRSSPQLAKSIKQGIIEINR